MGMVKIKIGLSALHYSVTMARFFWEALERRNDCDVYAIGPFYGNWIPWSNGIYLDNKYTKAPYVALPRTMGQAHVPYELFATQMPDDLDLFLVIDAGWHFSTRPKAKQVALIKTDPHAISKNHYNQVKSYTDYTFNMQTPYIESGEIFLPYAVAPWHSYPMDLEKIYDVCMIGLQYQHRINLERELETRGRKVKGGIGIVFDEYREAYNQSRIALSWSSLKDTPNRCYEAFGMKVPLVSNRVPDLCTLFTEGEHFLGFDNHAEAIQQIGWLLDHPEDGKEMAERAYQAVMNGHTWDDRVQFILETCGIL